MRRLVMLVLLVSLVTATAFAQAPGQTPPGPLGHGSAQRQPPPDAPTKAGKETKRDRVKKRIRAIRAYTLADELGLDEAEAGKLFPVLARYDDDFDKLLQQHADLQRRLDAAGDLKDRRAIDKVIDEAVANQRAFWDLEDKRLSELRKLLAPAQIARLLIVLPALERKIQNQLRNAIKPNQNKNRQLEVDDDDVEPGEQAPLRAAPPGPRPQPVPPPAPRGDKKCDPFEAVHGCSR